MAFGDFAASAFEGRLPCEDAAAFEVIVAGDAELCLATAVGRCEALPLAFHLAGGGALLVFENNFDLALALARSGRIAPVHGVIMPKTVVAFSSGEGSVQATQFFHADHFLVGFRGGEIAHEERIHLE